MDNKIKIISITPEELNEYLNKYYILVLNEGNIGKELYNEFSSIEDERYFIIAYSKNIFSLKNVKEILHSRFS